MKDWFTADLHLNHKNIIKYCNRPFTDIYQMDNVLINNILARVKPGDNLYLLGDISFKLDVALAFLNKIPKKVNVFLIEGNHDHKRLKEYLPTFQIKDICINKQWITLCHKVMYTWNESHRGGWNLFAHSHGNLSPIGLQHDVGVDNNGYVPLSFEDVVEIMGKGEIKGIKNPEKYDGHY